ncbi:hypothetical protein [Desulfosarcina alkanivorans]|jgi:hypothetical protein|uniref:hypothetical protein n=1 Tax=Desulfosarcina alkanivorans TaxID=571177 RepID=UPI0012D30835|nr:hypothetical protein [Desulfosarcina alkanivorans]
MNADRTRESKKCAFPVLEGQAGATSCMTPEKRKLAENDCCLVDSYPFESTIRVKTEPNRPERQPCHLLCTESLFRLAGICDALAVIRKK